MTRCQRRKAMIEEVNRRRGIDRQLFASNLRSLGSGSGRKLAHATKRCISTVQAWECGYAGIPTAVADAVARAASHPESFEAVLRELSNVKLDNHALAAMDSRLESRFPERFIQAKSDYLLGKSIKAAASSNHIGYSALKDYLCRAEVEIVPRKVRNAIQGQRQRAARRALYESLLQEGLTKPQIAERLGVKTSTVTEQMCRMGLRGKDYYQPYATTAEPELIREAARLHARGYDRDALATSLHISKTRATWLLKAISNGVSPQRRDRP